MGFFLCGGISIGVQIVPHIESGSWLVDVFYYVLKTKVEFNSYRIQSHAIGNAALNSAIFR